jgi:uncharacterized membrane protein YraQ (UPF0718 family)
VTFSFLVTSPLVNEVAVAVLLGSFGLKTTAIYVVTGITLGVVSGIAIDRLKLEHLLTDWVHRLWEEAEADREAFVGEHKTFIQRVAVVGLSIPEAMLLKKVMTIKLIAIFFGIVTTCIIFSGYFFNWIL